MKHTFRYLAPGPLAEGERVALAPDDARHCMRVVRRGVGDTVELIDGDGGLWAATVTAVDTGVDVLVGARRPAPELAPVVLGVGLLDSARLDMVVEKATELGVRECVVVLSERVRRVPEEAAWRRRSARLDRVVEAAARQSGRGRLMRVRGLVRFGDIVADTATGTGFLIDPGGDIPLGAELRAVNRPERPLTLLVGPEAGFAPHEVRQAEAAGWTICTLGASVLRAETAALGATALACDAAGHLGAAGEDS